MLKFLDYLNPAIFNYYYIFYTQDLPENTPSEWSFPLKILLLLLLLLICYQEQEYILYKRNSPPKMFGVCFFRDVAVSSFYCIQLPF